MKTQSLEGRQAEWRTQFVEPLETMFRHAGIFFTINLFDMDRILKEHAQSRGNLASDASMSQRMAHYVSPEAAALYRKMLKTTFPWY